MEKTKLETLRSIMSDDELRALADQDYGRCIALVSQRTGQHPIVAEGMIALAYGVLFQRLFAKMPERAAA